jgi:hypothetical protein
LGKDRGLGSSLRFSLLTEMERNRAASLWFLGDEVVLPIIHNVIYHRLFSTRIVAPTPRVLDHNSHSLPKLSTRSSRVGRNPSTDHTRLPMDQNATDGSSGPSNTTSNPLPFGEGTHSLEPGYGEAADLVTRKVFDHSHSTLGTRTSVGSHAPLVRRLLHRPASRRG